MINLSSLDDIKISSAVPSVRYNTLNEPSYETTITLNFKSYLDFETEANCITSNGSNKAVIREDLTLVCP